MLARLAAMAEFEDLKEKSPELKVSDDETIVGLRVGESGAARSNENEILRAEEQEPATHPDFAGSAEDQGEDLIGKTIGGHYEILSKLGHGGMATVYKARHTLLDKLVAIKFILPKLIYDEQSARRFKQEAKASTQLNHENVCTVREFEVYEGNRAFLVMDFLDGKPLVEILRTERTLERDRALSIASQLCAGLAHAHAKGIIHRDIKPGNILLQKDEKGIESVKIVDFGLAKLLREDQAGPDLTQTGEVFGTPLYMSPEQCLGRKVDARSDVYSVGCVLHEMVHGVPPFRADSTVEVMLHHVNELPELDGSNNIDAVIVKCLQKNPDRRYANAEELMEDINDLRQNRKPTYAKPKDPKIHRRIGIALITVCLLTAGTIGGITYKHTLDQREFHKQWNVFYEKSRQLIAEKHYDDAEKNLENALIVAKNSNNHELITVTYGTLATVEQNLGKVDEAIEHSRAAGERPDTVRVQQFFMATAFILIFIGLMFFLLILFLFGSNKKHKKLLNSSLSELFTKK